MTLDIAIVLGIILVTLYLFITEKYGIDTVAIITMTLLMVTGILTPKEGFAGFNNYATITVACMFVISAAIQKSGALHKVDSLLTSVGRRSYTLTLLTIMIMAGGLSAFMNDTAVVALFMPVILQVSKQTGINASRLLIPLSFGALLGGICTLVGTSTNILVSGLAEQYKLPPISMFEMTLPGLCFLGAGTLYLLITSRFLLPDRKTKYNLVEEFEMSNYLTEIQLLPGAKSVGRTIRDSPLVQDIELEIVRVVRDGIDLQPTPYLRLEANDVLTISCNVDKLEKLMTREGIRLVNDDVMTGDSLQSSSISFVKAMVTASSRMHDKTLIEYRFRLRFQGASVIAIRHRDEIIHEKLGNTKLKSGDVLLVSCNDVQMETLRKSDDLLIMSRVQHEKVNLKKLFGTLAIVVGIITTAALGVAPIVLTATVGVLVLVMFKLLNPQEAYQAVEWKVIFMLAGVLSLGAALEKTGAANLLASGIIKTIGEFGPQAVLSAFFGLTFLSTNFMSNTATAALLTPIAIASAQSMGIDSRPLILAVAFGASLSFMTPMGYQTNAMVYGPGNYKFKDFLRVGVPLNLLLWILASFILPYFFPF